MLGDETVCKTYKHREEIITEKIKQIKDSKIYTGSTNDGYLLMLPLQFYYDDEALQDDYTIDFLLLSISQVSLLSKSILSFSP